MKQDDRGVSLVEILIATAILVICVVPLFKSMILTVQTNAKSRVLLAATSAGEAVLEDLKADGMEAFIQDKDSKQISDVGYIEEDGKKVKIVFWDNVAGELVASASEYKCLNDYIDDIEFKK